MNEIQLIRNQLIAERERAGVVARTCIAALAGADPRILTPGAALEQLRQASVEYLTCVLAWFEERDERLRERYAQLPADDPDRRSLEQMLGGGGSSREALERLERAAGHSAGESDDAPGSRPGQRWQEFARFFAGPWTGRREAIERVLSSNPRVADWRAIGGMDADSILEERRRYARVRQCLPPGTAAPAGS